MPKKIKVNKQLGPGRPKKAVNVASMPEKYGTLPKKIMGSHMGYMQTGGSEHPPIVKGPALGKPAKLPPKPRQAPPN